MRIFLVFLLSGVLLTTISCQPESAEETENKIIKSDRLTRLNELCESLPKLASTNLKSKKITGNSGISSLTFKYERDVPWKDVLVQYNKWFADNDWVKNEDTLSGWYGTYTKGEYRISVETNDARNLFTTCMRF